MVNYLVQSMWNTNMKKKCIDCFVVHVCFVFLRISQCSLSCVLYPCPLCRLTDSKNVVLHQPRVVVLSKQPGLRLLFLEVKVFFLVCFQHLLLLHSYVNVTQQLFGGCCKPYYVIMWKQSITALSLCVITSIPSKFIRSFCAILLTTVVYLKCLKKRWMVS